MLKNADQGGQRKAPWLGKDFRIFKSEGLKQVQPTSDKCSAVFCKFKRATEKASKLIAEKKSDVLIREGKVTLSTAANTGTDGRTVPQKE
jgi:hypothetical protein